MNKLKLYLNENLSWRISKSLIEYGYDVISSHEADMNSEEDEAQFEFAISEGRTVVTNNFSHFVNLHKKYLEGGKSHCGIIFTTKCTIPAMIKRLRNLLQSLSSEQMKNQIRWLNEFQ